MKCCGKCKIEKSTSEFWKNKSQSDGFQNTCKSCQRIINKVWVKDNRAKMTEYTRILRNKDKEKYDTGVYLAGIKRNYGLEPGDLFNLIEEQEGVCAVCGLPPDAIYSKQKRLCVDHNHQTGRVRGLLCTRCNLILGKVKDDPSILLNLLAYLLDDQCPEEFSSGWILDMTIGGQGHG